MVTIQEYADCILRPAFERELAKRAQRNGTTIEQERAAWDAFMAADENDLNFVIDLHGTRIPLEFTPYDNDDNDNNNDTY